MSSAIIKVHPDHDLYIRFSTVVMGITAEGTRAEIMALYPTSVDDETMARVDEIGTSLEPGPYQEFAWGSNDVIFNDDDIIPVRDLPSLYGISGTR